MLVAVFCVFHSDVQPDFNCVHWNSFYHAKLAAELLHRS